jgi:predicted alpha/beta hydrolase family esterase
MTNADRRFWQACWAAADLSRAYRRMAEDWHACGVPDWATRYEAAAEALDAEWTARMAARHQAEGRPR